MDQTYYTVEEVAAILRISVETVRSYINRKKNKLPAYRLGREYRIDKEDFEKWMKERKNIQGE